MKATEADIDALLKQVARINRLGELAAKEVAKLEEQNRVTQIALANHSAEAAELVARYTGSPTLRRAYLDWANSIFKLGSTADAESKSKATAIRNLLNHTNT